MKSAWLKVHEWRKQKKNYKSESIQIKIIPMKNEKIRQKQKTNEMCSNEKNVYDWKNIYETKLYE